MNAWDIEEIADNLVDNIMAKAEQTMTPEQTVDLLLYLGELIELATRIALIDVGKRSH